MAKHSLGFKALGKKYKTVYVVFFMEELNRERERDEGRGLGVQGSARLPGTS